MNKLSKDKRDKLILIILFSVGISAVLYYLVIMVQQEMIADFATRTANRQAKLDQAEGIKKRRERFHENLAEQRKILNAKQADMPRPDQDHLWFINLMEERRRIYGLNVEEVRTPEPTMAGVLPEFPFRAVALSVTMSGRFTDFGRFLADFENSFPYMRVELTSITPEVRSRVTERAPGAAPQTATEISALPPPPEGTDRLRFNFRVIALLKTPTT